MWFQKSNCSEWRWNQFLNFRSELRWRKIWNDIQFQRYVDTAKSWKWLGNWLENLILRVESQWTQQPRCYDSMYQPLLRQVARGSHAAFSMGCATDPGLCNKWYAKHRACGDYFLPTGCNSHATFVLAPWFIFEVVFLSIPNHLFFLVNQTVYLQVESSSLSYCLLHGVPIFAQRHPGTVSKRSCLLCPSGGGPRLYHDCTHGSQVIHLNEWQVFLEHLFSAQHCSGVL